MIKNNVAVKSKNKEMRFWNIFLGESKQKQN